MKETINKGIANPHTQPQRMIALAIGRCLQRTNAFSDYQGTTLQSFLQSGKLTNASDLDYIYTKAKNL